MFWCDIAEEIVAAAADDSCDVVGTHRRRLWAVDAEDGKGAVASAFDDGYVGGRLLGQLQESVFLAFAGGDVVRAAEDGLDGAGLHGSVRVGAPLFPAAAMMGTLDVGDGIAAARQFGDDLHGEARLALSRAGGRDRNDGDGAAAVGVDGQGVLVSRRRVDVFI